MKAHFLLSSATLTVCIGLGLTSIDARAQVITEGQIEYSLGELTVRETPTLISISKGVHVLLTSTIRPGGVLDPDIHADESGVLTAGPHSVDLKSGKSIHIAKTSRCGEPTPREMFATHAARTVIVSPELDNDGKTTGYFTRTLSLSNCRQTAKTKILPQLADNFFEFRASSSGWWLIGSQDATILTTSTGRHWQRVLPPQDVHNILTANWASDGNFWILANKRVGSDLIPTLYKTRNSGRTWMTVEAIPVNVPGYWFEARRQLATATQP